MICDGRLDGGAHRTYVCTLDRGHEPKNHEAWADGELVAEWSDESYGAWRQR